MLLRQSTFTGISMMILIAVSGTLCFAQQVPPEFQPLITGKTTEKQIEILDSVASAIRKDRPEETKQILKWTIQECAAEQLDSLQIEQRIILSRIHRARGEHDSAVLQLDSAIRFAKERNFTHLLTQAMGQKGVALTKLGDYGSATATYIEGIQIAETARDTPMLALLKQNWGSMYFYSLDFNQAINYTRQAYYHFAAIHDTTSMANTIDNIGLYFSNLRQFDSALVYQSKALIIFEKIQDTAQLIICYNNMGSTLTKLNRFPEAEEYLLRSLEMAEEQDDTYHVVTALQSLGQLYFETGDEGKLQTHMERGFQLATELRDAFHANDAALQLGESYYRQRNFERSAYYYRMADSLGNIVFNEEMAAAAEEAAVKYEAVEKKKQIEVLEARNKEAEVRSERDKLVKWIIFGIALVLLAFSGFIVRRYFEKKKDNKLLHEKNEAIAAQKVLIEVKNEEIMDSINYATRIQNAVLPSDERLNALFDGIFVYFQPRDVISGDFYWAAELKNGCRFIAVADCTGHGVPGAMMSMLGTSLLDRIISSGNDITPGRILDELHNELLSTLNESQHTRQVSDGMDAAVLMFDARNKKVIIASADRPVYYIAEGKLNVIAPDKISIGSSLAKTNPYVEHILPVDAPIRFYMFSDGITDQFGGPHLKKFMSKRLKQLITDAITKRNEEIPAIFTRVFNDWKSEVEQTDDMTLVSFVIQ